MSIQRPAIALVATPIGNRADISQRALETLRDSDLILAEDTRNSGTLLASYAISRPLLALHDHNEHASIDHILDRIERNGMLVSVISDAGTPVISDPGYLLVRAAHQRGITVTVIPGACAAIAALAMSGLPAHTFVFEGFLPTRQAARRARLAQLKAEQRTLILYEAPHRLLALLADVRAVFDGDREIAIARELTKLHETLYRGTVAGILEVVDADANAARGEIVVLLGPGPAAGIDTAQVERVLRVALKYLSPRDAATMAAELTGARRNEVYRLCLDLQPPDPHS